MRWAELVFHVLAHVRVAAPASAYDEAWIRFVESHAGPARERTLADDALAIAGAASTHELLAAAQLVAWLFDDHARAEACSDRMLEELTPKDVDDPGVLRALQQHRVAAEVLRAAAELESDVVRALPAMTPEATPTIAPWVSSFQMIPLRPLRVRGRVYRDRIFVGVAGALGVSAEHVAFQAAHEATVSVLHRAARDAKLAITHHSLENAAIAMLREYVDDAAAHARWVAHFTAVPNDPLTAEWRALVDQSLARW